MKLFQFALLIVLGLMVTACASDPSAEDLKSPCVSNSFDSKAPCVRRSPVDNIVV